MPNGLLTGYKRKRKKRRKVSRVERTKCCRTDSELLSLFLFSFCFCSIASVAGFRGGSRCSWNAPSASCSTSDLFFRFYSSQQAGIGICSPPCPFSLYLFRAPPWVVKSCAVICLHSKVHIRCCSYLCRFLFAFSVLKGRAPV